MRFLNKCVHKIQDTAQSIPRMPPFRPVSRGASCTACNVSVVPAGGAGPGYGGAAGGGYPGRTETLSHIKLSLSFSDIQHTLCNYKIQTLWTP